MSAEKPIYTSGILKTQHIQKSDWLLKKEIDKLVDEVYSQNESWAQAEKECEELLQRVMRKD
jgi:hypothetical protein